MCPWNDGRWSLEAGAEGAVAKRTNESPQLTMDVSALLQLLYGQISPTNAVRCGRAEAAPDAPLPLWDAMWRTEYAPYLPQHVLGFAGSTAGRRSRGVTGGMR